MKISLTLLLTLFTIFTFSQKKEEQFSIKKGIWSIEADFSINSRNSDYLDNPNDLSSKNFNFNFSPKIGYAIHKNLIIGLGLGYNYSKSESDTENMIAFNHSKVNSISIFPYIKKFFPISKKVAFHLQGETNFRFNKITFDNNSNNNIIESELKGESFFIGVRPGIDYSLTKNIILQANFGSLGYNYESTEVDNEDNFKSNTFGVDFSSSNLLFGITLLL